MFGGELLCSSSSERVRPPQPSTVMMRPSCRFKNIRFTVEDGASLVFEKFVFFGPNNQVCARACAWCVCVCVFRSCRCVGGLQYTPHPR